MGLYSPFISMQIKYMYNIICSYYSLLVKMSKSISNKIFRIYGFCIYLFICFFYIYFYIVFIFPSQISNDGIFFYKMIVLYFDSTIFII